MKTKIKRDGADTGKVVDTPTFTATQYKLLAEEDTSLRTAKIARNKPCPCGGVRRFEAWHSGR
jgi:hypothetical protein